MTFPDEKMIRAAARDMAALDGDNLTLFESDIETFADDLKSYDDYVGSIIAAALTDYRTRTGIDVADVVGKLMAKTHVVVPVDPTNKMAEVGADARWRSAVRSADNVREIYRAMISATQEKPNPDSLPPESVV